MARDVVSVDIAAPPDTVWAMVSDVRRMGEWSPGRAFAFRNTVGNVLWRYEFHEVEGGTRLVEQRDISQMHGGLIKAFYKPMGGYENRTRTLLAGMQTTVERIKAAVEG